MLSPQPIKNIGKVFILTYHKILMCWVRTSDSTQETQKVRQWTSGEMNEPGVGSKYPNQLFSCEWTPYNPSDPAWNNPTMCLQKQPSTFLSADFVNVVISTSCPGSKESSTGLTGKWTNNSNCVYLRKQIRWLITKHYICFWHFVLPWQSQLNVTSRNTASCHDAPSSSLLLSADLTGKIMNMCNNNHVLWERISWLIRMFSLHLRSAAAALKKAPLPRYIEAVYLELIVFSHLFSTWQNGHISLTATRSLGCLPEASVIVSNGSK